jgi:signal transduction histidine kinase
MVSALAKIRVEHAPTPPTHKSFVLAKQILRIANPALLVGVSYYVGTRIGFLLTPSGQPNSTFWPPNAILLGAFLLAPRRIWWTFLLAVLPAHMLAQLQAGVPVWTTIGWFVSNTGEALIGAFCITRLTRQGAIFDTVRGVLVFIVFGVLLAPFATSFLDAAAVVITGWGRGYWPLETERFWTNALAELTVVPAIVVCAQQGRGWFEPKSAARYWEAAALAIATVLVSVLVFGTQLVSPATTPAMLYAPLPLLVWATIRFGPGGLSLSLLAVALISIWYTIHGRPPFPYATQPQNILSLQILLCMVVVPLMFLSAVMAEARRSQESVRRTSVSLMEAQEQERHRIAHELHDELGQELALAQMKLNGLIEETADPLKPALTDLNDQLSAISTIAREISHGLYPRHLEYVGLATAVKRLCDDMRRGKHFSTNLVIGNLPEQLPPSVSLCLYRVVQETLHNVISHSQASNVRVELGADTAQIILRIIDDGIGFDLTHEVAGLGLPSMRERVRSVGGSIEITSSPNAGTKVEVTIPRREDRADQIPGAA